MGRFSFFMSASSLFCSLCFVTRFTDLFSYLTLPVGNSTPKLSRSIKLRLLTRFINGRLISPPHFPNEREARSDQQIVTPGATRWVSLFLHNFCENIYQIRLFPPLFFFFTSRGEYKLH